MEIERITNKVCQDLATTIEQNGEYPVVKGQHRSTYYLKFIGPFATFDKNLVVRAAQGIIRTTVETIGRWKTAKASSTLVEEPKEPKEPGMLMVLFGQSAVDEEQDDSEYASLPDDDRAAGQSGNK